MNGLSRLLNRHRSIRKFKPDPVDPALVERICSDAIAGASSYGNLNSLSLVLTRDAERKRGLCELHFKHKVVLGAPLIITVCVDWHRTRQWLRLRGARDNFNNLLGYHIAAFDAMIVAQNVCLGFEAEGLGICYLGTTLPSMAKIAQYLDLPDTCLPITTIVAGYPDEHPDKRDRLPPSAYLHEETYRRPSDEELEASYAQREVRGWARYMESPALAAEMAALGITSLAQFYTSEAKYCPDRFRRESVRLRATLEAAHFLP